VSDKSEFNYKYNFNKYVWIANSFFVYEFCFFNYFLRSDFSRFIERLDYHLQEVKRSNAYSADFMDDVTNIFAFGYRLPWQKVKSDDDDDDDTSADNSMDEKKEVGIENSRMASILPGV
jgi:hypothetical protein